MTTTVTKGTLTEVLESIAENLNRPSQVVPNVRFIHDSQFGFTLGYKTTKVGNITRVVGCVSFAHKPTRSGKQKPEMFSRKKGRSIVTERIEAYEYMTDPANSTDKPTNLPPNMFVAMGTTNLTIQVVNRFFENLFCSNIKAVKKSFGIDQDYRYDRQSPDDQLQNSYILTLASELVTNVVTTNISS